MTKHAYKATDVVTAIHELILPISCPNKIIHQPNGVLWKSFGMLFYKKKKERKNHKKRKMYNDACLRMFFCVLKLTKFDMVKMKYQMDIVQ